MIVFPTYENKNIHKNGDATLACISHASHTHRMLIDVLEVAACTVAFIRLSCVLFADGALFVFQKPRLKATTTKNVAAFDDLSRPTQIVQANHATLRYHCFIILFKST